MSKTKGTVALGLVTMGFGLGSSPASADTSSSTGGAGIPPVPTLRSAVCDEGTTWLCHTGQTLVLNGEGLDDARLVVFAGRRGRRDDAHVKPRTASEHRLTVDIPARARSGPVVVATRQTRSARTRRRLQIASRPAVAPEPDGSTGMFYVLGAAPATFRYQAQSASPGASIEAVRLSDGVAVRRWPVAADPTGAGAVRWNGTADGVPVAAGRYGFRVVGADIAQVTAAAGSVGEFTLLDHSFPVQGLHDFGRSPINGFGGGRGHQGQDVFAKCGTPIVAAHAGTVKWVRYQSRAGNYAVIERADGQAYAYMHMKAEALVGEGEKVYTGQPIGAVGDTGRASGCHLHFELWSAPGWREGGEAIDPLPELRRWDEAG